MMGKSHLAFNAASAVVVSSMVHVGGETYSWSYLLALLSGHLAFTPVALPSLLQKGIFYLLVLLGALLPDIDHPGSLLGRRCWFISYPLHRCFGHRSITHSLLAVLLLAVTCIALGSTGIALYSSQGASVSPVLLNTLHLALFSLLFGYIMHLLADSLTKEGIPLLWPYEKRYGLLPFTSLRFRTGTWVEYLLLWSFIFCIGVGFGTGNFSF
jgi:inner membrane protein